MQMIKLSLRRRWTASPMMVLVMSVFSGHTLACHPAEYQTENGCCPMCLPGSRVTRVCTETMSTSCLPCLDGTYMNKPTGLKQCFPCTNCNEGSGLKTKTSCKITSDTVCEPLEGFYCVESSDNDCNAAKKHRSCEPGQYISKNGTASSDTECSDCRDGSFSDGSFTSCRPHTQCKTKNLQLVKAGTASADAQCSSEAVTSRNVSLILLFTASFLSSVYFV
ncbi:tumor necrosis factor receptor superfamily member 14-like [Betta splendens]|uniref:Tumor necrosis factor receptor superfamily member 14-like n=1 Tax=Betta splendens TaxID=158456 RepID=A0A6P7N4K5_BETSP|nr:tumor necrosis factor receptor superfamily member 14-like [Betta splendens]